MTAHAGSATIRLVIDAGPNALHRVTSVLAHQRASVLSMHLRPHAEDARLRDVTIELTGNAAAAHQLVKRLRRLMPVHDVTA